MLTVDPGTDNEALWITGGIGLDRIEIFDGTLWTTSTRKMPHIIYSHEMIQVSEDKFLLVGGQDNTGTTLGNYQVYSKIGDSWQDHGMIRPLYSGRANPTWISARLMDNGQVGHCK